MAKKATSKKEEIKPKTSPRKQKIELKKSAKYQFKANSKAPYMLDGKVYEVTGEVAEILLEKNYGKLID